MKKRSESGLLIQQPESPYKEIATYIADFTGYPVDKISFDTKLNYDIKTDGDDAAELIEYFALKYSINLSEFKFKDYFYDEGFWPWPNFKHLYLWLKGQKIKKDFTVRDLINGIENKRLV